jgi:hypothetical protein
MKCPLCDKSLFDLGCDHFWCRQCGSMLDTGDGLPGRLILPDMLQEVVTAANLQPEQNGFGSTTVEVQYRVRRWGRGQETMTMTIVASGGRKVT